MIFTFLLSILCFILFSESAGLTAAHAATVVISLIGFLMVAAVAFVPNLGEKQSLTFTGIDMIMRTINFVLVTVLALVAPNMLEDPSINNIFRALSLMTLSCVIYISTCYKYLDKEERNTI